jgi:cytochrome c oxidase subunit 2
MLIRSRAALTLGTAMPSGQSETRGCAGSGLELRTRVPQSILHTAGRDASEIAAVFWWMTGGATLIWIAVTALILFASARRRRTQLSDSGAHRLILIAGVVTPVVVLTGLLFWGLQPLARGHAMAADEPAGLLVEVEAEQWWWRVWYVSAQGDRIETANEVRLPVNTHVRVTLSSDNVIHAFWIPSLAGKVDMIPGRITQLRLEPTRTGLFRGVCAEYCGTSHAHMAFDAVVVPADDFDVWLREQAAPALQPGDERARRGQELFASTGCGACHTIRGTQAAGRIGPDLTHVGSRRSLAASTLPNDAATMAAWLKDPHAVKPDAAMPAFAMLSNDDLRSLAAYLGGLR